MVHASQDEGPLLFCFHHTQSSVTVWASKSWSTYFKRKKNKKTTTTVLSITKLAMFFTYADFPGWVKVLYYLIKSHNMMQFY